MAKINKYIAQIEELNKSFMNKIIEIGQEAQKDMQEYRLLYSESGALIKIRQRFEKAQEDADVLKQAHIQNLNYKLQVARAEIENNRENYLNKSTEEKILYELQKLNNYNSFSTKLKSMQDEEILSLANDEYLSEDKAALIRQELSARAESKQDNTLAIKARTIKATTATDLINAAQEKINCYANGSDYPGLSIAQQLSGNGVDSLLGGDYVQKMTSDYYFGNGGDIE